ncbi:MAG: hypothetical protein P9L99_05755 [Candidatus Lernaella stagnicola]|nr:hypothetical protein [Candidatus Lernaella stagnicola]
MRRLLIVASLFALLILPALAAAQDENPLGDVHSRAEAMKRLEMVRLYKLVEVLELNSEESARLFPIIQKYDARFRTVIEKVEKTYVELHKELISEKPNEAKLKKHVQTIFAHEREIMDIRDEQYRELNKELGAERSAKFMLFEKKFQREMQRVMDDVRGKRRHHMRQQRRQNDK